MRRVSATGGSAIKAVEVLKEHGVPEERIIFINLVSIRSSLSFAGFAARALRESTAAGLGLGARGRRAGAVVRAEEGGRFGVPAAEGRQAEYNSG